jgi:hypothetical protein
MNCQFCQTKITCGCQERTASDGTKVCQSCIARYENLLLVQQNNQANLSNTQRTNAEQK